MSPCDLTWCMSCDECGSHCLSQRWAVYVHAQTRFIGTTPPVLLWLCAICMERQKRDPRIQVAAVEAAR